MQGIGNRMKINYEEVWKIKLPWRMSVIIRLDGRAFHTLTRGMDKPFDPAFIKTMADTAEYLCHNVATTNVAVAGSIIMYDRYAKHLRNNTG